MEFYARWAHRHLWHDFQPGWRIHRTHHCKRLGPFEANDIFAAANAAPAIALCAWGFFKSGILPAAAFGAGLGMTLFGMSYMFVHDGLVHKRFPTGAMGKVGSCCPATHCVTGEQLLQGEHLLVVHKR